MNKRYPGRFVHRVRATDGHRIIPGSDLAVYRYGPHSVDGMEALAGGRMTTWLYHVKKAARSPFVNKNEWIHDVREWLATPAGTRNGGTPEKKSEEADKGCNKSTLFVSSDGVHWLKCQWDRITSPWQSDAAEHEPTVWSVGAQLRRTASDKVVSGFRDG